MHTLTRTEVRSSHLRAFALDGVRVALVPEQALLLAGDHVTVAVRVGSGQRLEIVEPGGTVAYAMRGGQARWDVQIVVERGRIAGVARRAVRRHTRVPTSCGRRRSTWLPVRASGSGRRWSWVVPARDRAGWWSRTEVNRDGVPVLVEELDAALGLGSHRVVDQVLELGGFETVAERPPQPPGGAERPPQPPEAMVLESGDRLHRWLGAEAHASPMSVLSRR